MSAGPTRPLGWWERSSPNHDPSDASRTIGVVTLTRPVRPPSGVIDGIRGAILREAYNRFRLDPPMVLSRHTRADYLGHNRDLLDDMDRRYRQPPGSFGLRVAIRMTGQSDLSYSPQVEEQVSSRKGARSILLELPDADFLTAIQNAVTAQIECGRVDAANAQRFYRYAGEALRAHGAPYRHAADAYCFEWVGDPKQHALTVEPALLALGDARLEGARGEFEEALSKRRRGTPKDLEDAVDEAAKAVESMLKVLHAEHNVTPPRGQQVTPLFNSLVTANVLPGYVDKLVAGAAGPRNQVASHGQGATVRAVPEELADASIAAAATAITLLAHYLQHDRRRTPAR
jgi:hypothetical protein